MEFSVVGGLVDYFTSAEEIGFELLALAIGAVGLNTLPDRVTSVHISVA